MRQVLISILVAISQIATAYSAWNYNDDLKRFEYDAEVKALRAALADLDPAEVAAGLRIKPPIYPPKLSPDQVVVLIEDELQRLVKEKFPSSRYNEIKKEAEQQFKMYKVGDYVTIVRQYGRQMLEKKGLLEFVTPEMVKISGEPINKRDISREYLAHLYWTDHEDAIKKYVSIQTRRFEEERAEFQKAERNRLTKNIWRESGYKQLRKSGKFVANLDLFYKKYDYLRDKAVASLTNGIREEIYKENKYVYDEKYGGWVPHSVVLVESAKAEGAGEASLLGKVKMFFKTTAEEAPKPKPEAAPKETATVAETGAPVEAAAEEIEFDTDEDLWNEEFLRDDSEASLEAPQQEEGSSEDAESPPSE